MLAYYTTIMPLFSRRDNLNAGNMYEPGLGRRLRNRFRAGRARVAARYAAAKQGARQRFARARQGFAARRASFAEGARARATAARQRYNKFRANVGESMKERHAIYKQRRNLRRKTLVNGAKTVSGLNVYAVKNNKGQITRYVTKNDTPLQKYNNRNARGGAVYAAERVSPNGWKFQTRGGEQRRAVYANKGGGYMAASGAHLWKLPNGTFTAKNPNKNMMKQVAAKYQQRRQAQHRGKKANWERSVQQNAARRNRAGLSLHNVEGWLATNPSPIEWYEHVTRMGYNTKNLINVARQGERNSNKAKLAEAARRAIATLSPNQANSSKNAAIRRRLVANRRRYMSSIGH